ncbi:transcription factor MYB44-like [Lolium rigidum]|uniref:transcription factor MYB44-like n=1 Tax=Lolium rigidum TaxID=89674 RepID=UPI001F5D1CD4|nr:transcription factor MYB44-like [Lolium rigidum]
MPVVGSASPVLSGYMRRLQVVTLFSVELMWSEAEAKKSFIAAGMSFNKAVGKAWTQEEDTVLREQVRLHGGPSNWNAICQALPGRNSAACRQRWVRFLSPTIDVDKPFTAAEDQIIVANQARYGNRWTTIAHFLPGRTDLAISNRWKSVLSTQHGAHASTPAPAPAAARAAGPVLPLVRGGTSSATHATQEDLTGDEAPLMECLQLFPLAPGDIRADPRAAPSSDLSCGADDPLTQLRLAPAPAATVVDAMPL